MKHYFDPETSGFHSDRFDGPREIPAEQTERELKAGKRPLMLPNPATTIPAGAIEITAERYAELMEAQTSGKRIVARGGKPVAVEPQPSAEEAREARRRTRDRRLAASDWTQLADALVLDLPLKAQWASYRQQLRDLDMDGTEWPDAPGGDL